MVGLLEMWCVRRVLEPHQVLARCFQGTRVTLSGCSWRHLVKAALHHDDGHVDTDAARVCERRAGRTRNRSAGRN